jgi:hypothetical protein
MTTIHESMQNGIMLCRVLGIGCLVSNLMLWSMPSSDALAI